MIGLQVGRKSF